MKKPFPGKSARLVVCLALAALLALGAGLACWNHLRHPAAPAPAGSAAAMLDALQDSTAPWEAQLGDLSGLLADLRGNAIASAALDDDAVYVTRTDGGRYVVADPHGRIADHLLQAYTDAGARFPLALRDAGQPVWLSELIATWPTLLLVAVGLGVLATRLRPYSVLRKGTGVTFDDVVGASEAKLALRDVTAWLRDPQAYAALGARPPKGVLLTGEPGTGKTQLAKALASECGASFIQVTGGDFSSMYFGVGVQKVKALFRTARRHAPCIIFIDEIDGIGRRGEQARSADAEGNRIVNQFLTELDGFSGASGVLVLGATNFPHSLDPALVREGRFDRSIAVALPTLAEREQLFRLYAGKIRLNGEPDYKQLARNTVGLTPAAIAYIVNHAALVAARAGADGIDMAHFSEAVETCRIGEQPSGTTALSEADRTRIAVHEAGHAIVAAALKTGRVEKVTILPRGQALGVTLVTPTEDKRLHLESELRARIQMLLAGRGAEQLYFHEVSSGAGQDLQEASKLALSMVGALGMGPNGSLLSLQAVRDAHLDSDPREALEAADRLLQQLNQDCLALLQRLKPALDRITARLLEDETVPGEEVVAAVAALPEAALPASAHANGAVRHLERVAASAYDNLDPLFDLGELEAPEDVDSGPRMA